MKCYRMHRMTLKPTTVHPEWNQKQLMNLSDGNGTLLIGIRCTEKQANYGWAYNRKQNACIMHIHETKKR